LELEELEAQAAARVEAQEVKLAEDGQRLAAQLQHHEEIEARSGPINLYTRQCNQQMASILYKPDQPVWGGFALGGGGTALGTCQMTWFHILARACLAL
jgi:hypothetical protein